MGFVLALGSALFFALQSAFGKRAGQEVHPNLVAWAAFAFALPFYVGALLVDGLPTVEPVFWAWRVSGSELERGGFRAALMGGFFLFPHHAVQGLVDGGDCPPGLAREDGRSLASGADEDDGSCLRLLIDDGLHERGLARTSGPDHDGDGLACLECFSDCDERFFLIA